MNGTNQKQFIELNVDNFRNGERLYSGTPLRFVGELYFEPDKTRVHSQYIKTPTGGEFGIHKRELKKRGYLIERKY